MEMPSTSPPARDAAVMETLDGAIEGVNFEIEVVAVRTKSIQTKGLFNFMELPVELRLKIFELLLLVDGDIEIPSQLPHLPPSETINNSSSTLNTSILRTCKKINEEATPIFYGKNTFTVLCPTMIKDAAPAGDYMFNTFRWSTIMMIPSITFCRPRKDPIPDTIFTTSGPNIIKHFSQYELNRSPFKPSDNMALSLALWINISLTRKAIENFHERSVLSIPNW